MMNSRVRTSFGLALLSSFLLFSSLSAQELSLRVRFENEPLRGATIGLRHHKGVQYASLNDLARMLSLPVRSDLQTQQLIITHPLYRLTFSANNSFVAITDRSETTISYQLPVAIRASNNEFFIPLSAAGSLLEKTIGRAARVDAATNTLRIGSAVPAKPSFDISTLILEQRSNGMLIRVPATRPLTDYESLLKQDGWLYVTIPNARADIASINKIRPSGAVTKILATQFPTSVQLTFKLEGTFSSSSIMKDNASLDLLIMVHASGDEIKSTVKKIAPRSTGLDALRRKHELDVIVLDAGHGGKDPGAIGVTGTREKDVALSIVLKLGKLITSNLSGVKVVYTRDDDTFVELYRRGQIANKADGKLFISVHCNSMPKKPFPRRGFEVYLLRPGRTDEAIAIAERENSVIKLEEGYEQRYKKLTDENFILVTMAQTAHMRASEVLAEMTIKEMDARLNTPNNGVTQAGFLVLVGSAMPSIYVETAYLSNREDEQLLKSESGQQKYAEAIFNAIKRYKEENEKLLREGKDMGANGR